MNTLKFHYSIRSELPGCAESPASIGAKFVRTLDALSRIDSSTFANWQIMDFPSRDSIPLAQARARIGAIIERNVTRDDFGQPEPYYGYGADAFTGNVMKSHHIDLLIKTGGESKGYMWLKTGYWKVPPDPAIVTYPLFKAALLAINAIWPSPWACAQAFRAAFVEVPVDYGPGVLASKSERLPMVPNDPTFPESVFHIPWLAYLSAPLGADVKLPAEILTERTPDGGLLMTATEERLDPANPEHLRRSRILAETMIARAGDTSR